MTPIRTVDVNTYIIGAACKQGMSEGNEFYEYLEDLFLNHFESYGDRFNIPNRYVLNGFSINDIPFCVEHVCLLRDDSVDLKNTYLSIMGNTNYKYNSLMELSIAEELNFEYCILKLEVPLFRFYLKNCHIIKRKEWKDNNDNHIRLRISLANLHDMVF